MPKENNIQEQARKIWQETRRQLVTLGHQTVELAKKGEEEVLRYTELGRLRWDVLMLKRKLDDLYAQLGKEVFELGIQGKIKEPQIKELCSQISELQDQVNTKEKEIADTRKRKS